MEKKTELTLKIEATQKILSELQIQLQNELKQEELRKIKENEDKFKIPFVEIGEHIFWLNIESGKVYVKNALSNPKHHVDKHFNENYNYFSTKEEAQKLADYFNTFLKAYHVQKVLNKDIQTDFVDYISYDTKCKTYYPSMFTSTGVQQTKEFKKVMGKSALNLFPFDNYKPNEKDLQIN